jgi:hypothetical protein
MAEAATVRHNPRLNRPAAVWSNGNRIYGLMTEGGNAGGKGPDGVELVVMTPGGRPSFYSADSSAFDHGAGGTIVTGLGTIQSTGGFVSRTTLDAVTGEQLSLKGGGAVMMQNLKKMLDTSGGAVPKP